MNSLDFRIFQVHQSNCGVFAPLGKGIMMLFRLTWAIWFAAAASLASPASAAILNYAGTVTLQLAHAPALTVPIQTSVDSLTGVTSGVFGAGTATASASGLGSSIIFGPTGVTSALQIVGAPFVVTGTQGPVVEISVRICQIGSGNCAGHDVVYTAPFRVSNLPGTLVVPGTLATMTWAAQFLTGTVTSTVIVTGPRGTVLTGVPTAQFTASGVLSTFNAVAPIMVTSSTPGFFGGAGITTLSMSLVPEPGGGMLVGMGLALMALRRWRSHPRGA